jgi:Family of unknown function (DUF6188)
VNAVRGGGPDKHTWALSGAVVTQLVVDAAAVRLCCVDPSAELEVTLEAPFRYRDTGGVTISLNPAASAELGPALGMLGKDLTALEVSSAGELRLSFADGSWLTSARQEHFESWNVRGRGAVSEIAYLCTPHSGPPWTQRVS